ncbi:reverse transcriptase/maturase family protein [Limosilactobacillus caccae]|uniref:reverse transcriptase/maturase family protein n=1 Tax=Limosilactobacillus caccae TaxID=1926284 RepID=UPI0013564CA6|nr:reverse transcriptase/maturase family protein [Limosilactobacillus caccae]
MEKKISFNEIKLSTLREYLQRKNLKRTATTYKHFDKPLSNNIRCKIINEIIQNNNYVSSYRHLPFIEFPIVFQKYNRKKRKYNKTRIISLPSHHDAFLYKIYSKILYKSYEYYLTQNKLSEIPIAYRTGHSNITGARDAIDNIASQTSWVIKGDFSHFFDNLNHDVLMKNVKKVIESIDGGEFTDDWRSILKNLMDYRYIKLDDIINNPTYNLKNRTSYVKDLKELDNLIANNQLKVSRKHKVGIPQGTALSAILANVYMVEFDEWIRKYLQRFNGFYRRYSDDFIIVIPDQEFSIEKIREIEKTIIAKSRNNLFLTIKESKTRLYYFDKNRREIFLLSSGSNTLDKSELNYLGFSFNGIAVNLRPKTIYKFHYKGKKAVNSLAENMWIYKQTQKGMYNTEDENLNNWQKFVKESANKGYSIPKRKLYTQMYLVTKPIKRKNFLSYAWNAQKIFSQSNEKYEVNILKSALKQVGYLQRKFSEDKRNKE